MWAMLCWAATAFNALAQQPVNASVLKLQKDYERRYALVIGNSDYKHMAPLVNPKNDAADMCNTLRALGFETMCYENQRTKREMKDVVIRFTEKVAANHGVALFFYAGHGMQVGGENYLIPSGAELRSDADVEDESMNVNYLMAQLDRSKNPFNIVILDACRNDPISRGSRSAGRGLASMDHLPVGSVIIFATAPGKAAADGNGRNGLFTKHLLANMNAPGLSLEEMIKQVSRGVMAESSKFGVSQSPWWNSSFTGNFCFGGCADPVQGKELETIRKEKTLLEIEVRRVQQENAERQAVLASQEVKSKSTQAELEARIRQMQAQSQTESKPDPAVEELKKQLALLQVERLKQEEAQRKQKDEIQQLLARRNELDQKTAEIETMSRRLAELESEKLVQQRLLEGERAKQKATQDQQPAVNRRKTYDIPPTL